MPVSKSIKSKILAAVRFDSVSGYIGQGLGPLLSQNATRIAQIFVLKLSEEHRFGIGQEDHLQIFYTTDLPAGEIVVFESKSNAQFRTAHLGFSQAQFSASGGDEIEFTINAIAEVLRRIVCDDIAATSAIEKVQTELRQDRENSIVRMQNLYTETKGYKIEPYLKLGREYLLFVKVTEMKTGKTGTRLFLEGSEREIFRLVKSLSIKGNTVVAKHVSKTSVRNSVLLLDYEWRGFTLPVQANLEDIFSIRAFPRTREEIDG